MIVCQAIYSVSRAQLNVLMMEIAEKNGATLHFNEKCVAANMEKATAIIESFCKQDQADILKHLGWFLIKISD